MTKVNNISVEQAAINYTPFAHKSDKTAQHVRAAFKAGAQWQKEQDKELRDAAERALNYLSVKYPKEAEILHELKKAIGRYNH